MKICLAMIGRFEERDGVVYGDQKNINAIVRYLKYASSIYVVARRTKKPGLYERLAVDDCRGRVTFYLYDELEGWTDFFRAVLDFTRALRHCAARAHLVLSWSQPAIAWIWWQVHRCHKPLAVYVGGCNKDILFSYRSSWKRMAGWGIMLMTRWAIRRANYVHYVTEWVLQKKYPSTGKSIGATFARIAAPDQEMMATRLERIHMTRSQTTLGVIGYLNRVKGIDTAIQALATLDRSCQLRILGGGSRKWVQDLAARLGVADRVFFDGTLPPGQEIMAWLDHIDIYLQPSRAEGLPRATIEAMSRGCPTVCSSAGGLCELMEGEYRHRVGDWRQLGALVRNLLSHPDEMAMQARRNQTFVRKYEPTRMDTIIDRFFGDIAADISRPDKTGERTI